MYISISIDLSIYLPVCLSICLHIGLSLCVYLCVSTHSHGLARTWPMAQSRPETGLLMGSY